LLYALKIENAGVKSNWFSLPRVMAQSGGYARRESFSNSAAGQFRKSKEKPLTFSDIFLF
jgi:hypothetical protein